MVIVLVIVFIIFMLFIIVFTRRRIFHLLGGVVEWENLPIPENGFSVRDIVAPINFIQQNLGQNIPEVKKGLNDIYNEYIRCILSNDTIKDNTYDAFKNDIQASYNKFFNSIGGTRDPVELSIGENVVKELFDVTLEDYGGSVRDELMNKYEGWLCLLECQVALQLFGNNRYIPSKDSHQISIVPDTEFRKYTYTCREIPKISNYEQWIRYNISMGKDRMNQRPHLDEYYPGEDEKRCILFTPWAKYDANENKLMKQKGMTDDIFRIRLKPWILWAMNGIGDETEGSYINSMTNLTGTSWRPTYNGFIALPNYRDLILEGDDYTFIEYLSSLNDEMFKKGLCYGMYKKEYFGRIVDEGRHRVFRFKYVCVNRKCFKLSDGQVADYILRIVPFNRQTANKLHLLKSINPEFANTLLSNLTMYDMLKKMGVEYMRGFDIQDCNQWRPAGFEQIFYNRKDDVTYMGKKISHSAARENVMKVSISSVTGSIDMKNLKGITIRDFITKEDNIFKDHTELAVNPVNPVNPVNQPSLPQQAINPVNQPSLPQQAINPVNQPQPQQQVVNQPSLPQQQVVNPVNAVNPVINRPQECRDYHPYLTY